jgi:hypothetical protein
MFYYTTFFLIQHRAARTSTSVNGTRRYLNLLVPVDVEALAAVVCGVLLEKRKQVSVRQLLLLALDEKLRYPAESHLRPPASSSFPPALKRLDVLDLCLLLLFKVHLWVLVLQLAHLNHLRRSSPPLHWNLQEPGEEHARRENKARCLSLDPVVGHVSKSHEDEDEAQPDPAREDNKIKRERERERETEKERKRDRERDTEKERQRGLWEGGKVGK